MGGEKVSMEVNHSVKHFASLLVAGHCDSHSEMTARNMLKDELDLGYSTPMQIVIKTSKHEIVLWNSKR